MSTRRTSNQLTSVGARGQVRGGAAEGDGEAQGSRRRTGFSNSGSLRPWLRSRLCLRRLRLPRRRARAAAAHRARARVVAAATAPSAAATAQRLRGDAAGRPGRPRSVAHGRQGPHVLQRQHGTPEWRAVCLGWRLSSRSQKPSFACRSSTVWPPPLNAHSSSLRFHPPLHSRRASVGGWSCDYVRP